jgi:TonB family protein
MFRRSKSVRARSGFFLAMVVLSAFAIHAQDKDAAQRFEKLVAGSDPVLVDGERLYRAKEVSQRARVTVKPEPSYSDKARKKRAHGTVEMLAVFSATGKLRVLYVLKSLPYGLTEQALDAAARIEFKPALLDGRPVSQLIRLEYDFNPY